MKKRLLLILALTITVVGLYVLIYNPLKLIGPRSWSYFGTTTTTLEGEGIAGITLGADIKNPEFISRFGMNIPKDHDNSLYNYYRLADGLAVATELAENIVIRVRTDSSDYPTSRNIAVGDAVENVVNKYGADFYRRIEQGTDIMGYIDKSANVTIEFWYRSDSIVSIRYDISNME